MTMEKDAPILTLEPLVEAVRNGIETRGWPLSGLQKTTSHEFSGRWAGESTRSAYLFFHGEQTPDAVSVEAYLDETSERLAGNLSLVVGGPTLLAAGDPTDVLSRLALAAQDFLPADIRSPLTLRMRLRRPQEAVENASLEARFKLHLPAPVIQGGRGAVAAAVGGWVESYEGLLGHSVVQEFGGFA